MVDTEPDKVIDPMATVSRFHDLNSVVTVMADTREIKQALHESVIEAYINDYKELADIWRSLESKAQATVTIAGIFIAGVFAYVRETTTQMPFSERVSLGGSIVFLITCVVLSVLALRLRKVKVPVMGSEMSRLVGDMLAVDDDREFFERLPNYYHDQATSWQTVEDDVLKANQSKARFLWWSHICLVLAIIAVAAVTLIRLWR